MLTNLFLGQTAEEKLYVEDVFSTWLYTGNGSSQTITNGIDLAGKGGLVWIKNRVSLGNHFLFDTDRGATKYINTNLTNAQTTSATTLSSFSSAGFSLGTSVNTNTSDEAYASWTFRKAAKFFDVVTYTGDGTTGRSISHSLVSSPGMIIFKRTDTTSQWPVWHRSLSANTIMLLNTTDAAALSSGYVASVSSTTFTINANVNANGGTYVAYLFAHDTTADGVIQCGSFTTDASGNATISLGWEPQFVLYKTSSTTSAWYIADNMRGITSGGGVKLLSANASSAEGSYTQSYLEPTSTGFKDNGTFGTTVTVTYLAIRRGPMRVPTDATKVFLPSTSSGNLTTGFPVDAWIGSWRTGGDSSSSYVVDRLRSTQQLTTSSTAAEVNGSWTGWASNTSFAAGLSSGFANYLFRRAPGFFDVVCYTGTGSARTVSHNLGVAPELMIVKRRDTTADWQVYFGQSGEYMVLNTTAGKTSSNTDRWNNTAPTSAVFSLGTNAVVNASGGTYVAYLFSSCPGISKIGGYTGNGSSQNIDCGFTNGARFVLVKRTTATGSWTVFDTARGIVSAADPLLLLNTTDAEATNDSIDPLSSGFTINQTSSTNLNITAATYIYLAIA